jgi:hypothetical protein
MQKKQFNVRIPSELLTSVLEVCKTTGLRRDDFGEVAFDGVTETNLRRRNSEQMTQPIPSRFDLCKRNRTETLKELDRCAAILAHGLEQLSGCTDAEIRQVLGKHFPPPRVSEFCLVARAEPETYRRYRAGFIGFKATLAECRGYRLHSNEWLHQRKVRRAAERLVTLLDRGELDVAGHHVAVTPTAARLQA